MTKFFLPFIIVLLFFIIIGTNVLNDRLAGYKYIDQGAHKYLTASSEKPLSYSINILKRTDAKILIFGDTALLEPLGSRVESDRTYNPFMHVMDKFKTYDYVVGGQEATIDGASVGEPNPGKAYTFSVTKESVRIYQEASIDAMAYANNHARDYGPQSVMHTIELLTDGGIDVFGAGRNREEAFRPLIKEINENRIAFLAYNCAEFAYNIATENEAGTASFNEFRIRESIQSAKANADVVIVITHCGDEHVSTPNEMQRAFAHIYTSAGADIVIGGHPHVRQQPEVVNGKHVIHSTGNFMFPGQSWDPESLLTWAVEVNIKDKKLIDYKLIEAQMDADGVPSWR